MQQGQKINGKKYLFFYKETSRRDGNTFATYYVFKQITQQRIEKTRIVGLNPLALKADIADNMPQANFTN